MKIEDINNHNKKLFESRFTSNDDYDSRRVNELAEAYQEIDLLSRAFDSGKIGIIIGKNSNRFSHSEYFAIKDKVAAIINDNALIKTDRMNHTRDGYERMRLIARLTGHYVEAALGGAIAYYIIPLLFITTGGIGAAIGAGIALLFGLKKAKYLDDLHDLSKLLTLVSGAAKTRRYQPPKRSVVKKLLDTVMMKTPKEVNSDARRDIRKVKASIDKKMKRGLKKFPEFIEVKTDGVYEKVPIVNVFDV